MNFLLLVRPYLICPAIWKLVILLGMAEEGDNIFSTTMPLLALVLSLYPFSLHPLLTSTSTKMHIYTMCLILFGKETL